LDAARRAEERPEKGAQKPPHPAQEQGEVAAGGGFGLPILLVQSILFRLTDKQPTQRQLYQVVELGKPDGEATPNASVYAATGRSCTAEKTRSSTRLS
jgi:hypothetical protein